MKYFDNQVLYTKNGLIKKLQEIRDMGWIENKRQGNDGGVGNTLEDLLEIKENNLPLSNTSEWELKSQRINTNSLITLFHVEPSPRAIKFVSNFLLLKYGWSHHDAGRKYPIGEMSFRQTIRANVRSDRGFMVVINKKEHKILISFDAKSVDTINHNKWLEKVEKTVGFGELSPQPYWGFNDLKNKAGTKLLNTFYVRAEVKRENDKEQYKYSSALMLQNFSFENFLLELENGNLYVDFDARTGHNHGTKFRIKQNCLPNLYEVTTELL